MKVTLRDVAEAAGVSAMAVSAVLHGSGTNVKVSEEKAKLIRRLAQELHYQPNHLARSLRNHRTNTVSVVFQHFDRLTEDNPYYPQMLNGVMAALFPAKFTLALCPRLVERSAEGAISDGRFDGVLWCRPDFTEESVDGLRNSRTPVVMMHAPPGSAPGIPTFCADNEGAMKLAIEHLANLGHERVAFVTESISEPTAECRARASAFLRGIDEFGLSGEVIIWDGDVELLDAIRYRKIQHTAVVAFSDHIAGQFLTACRKRGIRIPHDLSVIGFDSSSFCNTTTPNLTSVYQPVERMAFEATTYLIQLIEGTARSSDPAVIVSSTYECLLDLRESTARPPGQKQRTSP